MYGVRTVRECLRLSSYLRHHPRIDIVHAYNFYANVFALPAARLAHVPVVLASIRDTGEIWTARQRAVNKLVCRFMTAWSSTLRPSNACWSPTAIVLSGLLYSQRDHLPAVAQRSRPRPAPGVWAVSDDLLIGIVSRIDRLKGLEYFLPLLTMFSRVPYAKFLIIGDNSFNPQYREELKQQWVTLGLQEKVIFTGFRLDVQEHRLQYPLFPLLVIGEGLSNSLLESMAAAVPVVG